MQVKFYTFLVVFIILYGCETWTSLAVSKKKIQAFESKCLRKVLCISHLKHKTNDGVPNNTNFLVGPQELF